MNFKAEIPYGAYWSTPFSRWQGSFAGLNSVEFAAHVTKAEMAKRDIDPKEIDYGVLGMSVIQNHSFYGLPWFTGLIGAEKVGGPTLAQACATSVRCLLAGAQEIEVGMATNTIVATCDRLSNGPHVYYPNPRGPGGTGVSEDWVLGNFSCDPLGGHAMVTTAENVAKKHEIGMEQQHELVLRRTEQYQDAIADDHAFQKRYMTLPFDVPDARYRKTATIMQGDEGITFSTTEGLAGLRPVLEGGTVSYGAQTHPADGNAGMMMTTADKAKEMSSNPNIRVEILGFGLDRAELAYMPEATIPAAHRALDAAGLKIDEIDAIKSHNPFAVNDIVFADAMGIDANNMNNYGCSLIWGHPQGATGMRAVIEMIEELALRGGGYGLFEGCAAGDTAMAVILKVSDRK